MFLTLSQIRDALSQLESVNPFFGMTFLAFKEGQLPIGRTSQLVFTKAVTEVLKRHYKPSSAYSGYFTPLKTSDPGNRWLAPRYPSTSLQRITADTFSDVLIHKKGTSNWGWQSNYVQLLTAHLGGKKVPAFNLSVWLFRDRDWPPETSPEDIREFFFESYGITQKERLEVFDSSVSREIRWQEQPVPEQELLDEIGWPPGVLPEEGLALHLLDLRSIGPARHLIYEPGEKLNIITGDNGFGKSFLLDCAWWALTGEWAERPALPDIDVPKMEPRIRFQVHRSGKQKAFEAFYNWDLHTWSYPATLQDLAGLVVYARYDGSFAVWDPARVSPNGPSHHHRPRQIFFRRVNLWDGLSLKDPFEGERWICNGLIRDVVSWQRSSESQNERFEAFTAALAQLSPSPNEPLRPGKPIRIPFDSRDIPSLTFPYGDVPITNCSAGVQRIVALGYLLVWAWFEHLENSRQLRREPQRTLVFLMDEVEAHLHPRWQRVLVPALTAVVSKLAPNGRPQIHLATHSPMIMTGVEVVANEGLDRLHHLDLADGFVEINQLPLIRRGRADRWLISEAFGLQHARSREAEHAIEQAKSLQRTEDPRISEVLETHNRLIRYLAPNDDFWPRWLYFAKIHGAEE